MMTEGNDTTPKKNSLYDDKDANPDADILLPVQNEVNASEQIDLQNILQLKEAFDFYDKDKSGKLDFQEFISAFGSVLAKDMTMKKLEQLFMKIDANSDGGVEWDEFMNYILLENQTLSRMREQNFDYLRNEEEDPNFSTSNCHEDMITKAMIVQPQGILKGETKYKIAQKIVTAAKDGNIKLFNIDGQYETSIEASASYILSMAFFADLNVLAISTETKELVFYEVQPSIQQASNPIGKFSPLSGVLLAMETLQLKKLKKHFLLGGDDAGHLHFMEFGQSWHICNEDLSCHKSKHKEFYWNKMVEKRKTIKEDVKKMNQEYKDGRLGQKKWLWRELENKNFYKVSNHHHMENVEMSQLELHESAINKIQYIPDLHVMVSCSNDCRILVTSFELLLELKNCNQPATLNALLKHVSTDPSINSEKKVKIFSGHRKAVKTFVWSPKFRLMASAGDERHIIVWDIFTCTRAHNLHGHTSSIVSLALNEERNHLFSLGVDKTVIVWDMKSSSMLKMIHDKITYYPEDILTDMIFEPSREKLILTSRKINLWPITFKFKSKYESKGTSHDDEVTFCIFNEFFDYLVSIDASNHIILWEIKTGTMVFKFVPEGIAKITAATLDEAGRRIIIGDVEGRVEIYNFNNGQQLQSVETKKGVEITSIIHTESIERGTQARVIAGGWEKRIYFWREDPEEILLDKVIPKSSLFEFHKYDITCMAYMDKYKSVISGDVEGNIVIWDNKMSTSHKFQNSLSSVISTHETEKTIISIIAYDSKDVFLTITSGQVMRVWCIVTQQIIYEKQANHYQKELLTNAVACKDETHISTADSDGYFKVWDITGVSNEPSKKDVFKELAFVRAQKTEITTMNFAVFHGIPYIITGSLDKNIRIFSIQGSLIGIFGKKLWNLASASAVIGVRPRIATPEVRRDQFKNTMLSFTKDSEADLKDLNLKRRDVSIDRDLQNSSHDKNSRRFSFLRPSHKLNGSAALAVPKSMNKSSIASRSIFNEDASDNYDSETEQKVPDRSFQVLESYKNERATSTILPTIEKPKWREKVESSIQEANKYLNEEAYEIRNLHVENILKKYGMPLRQQVQNTKQNRGYNLACIGKLLDSEKHAPLKAPIKLKQMVRYLSDTKSPKNKFNIDFFHKGVAVNEPLKQKERSRSVNVNRKRSKLINN